MAPSSLIHILALLSLVVFACSFGAAPLTALAYQHQHIRDVSALGHGAIARRKHATSNNSQRCKQRPSSSTTPKSTPKPSPKNTTHAVTPSTPLSGHKGCLAWPNGDSVPVKNSVGPATQYIYTWSPDMPSHIDNLTPVPMLWGKNQVEHFKERVVEGYATHVAAINEPNEKGQSNMSPEEAAQLWTTYITPLRKKGYTTFISPATSSNPNGVKWFKDFLKACNGGCYITHCGAHWYGTDPKEFIKYLELWHELCGLPLFVSEYACQNFAGDKQCTKDEIFAFTKTVIEYMDKTDWVTAYCPFGWMHEMQGVNPANQLMGSNNQPTALGQMYVN